MCPAPRRTCGARTPESLARRSRGARDPQGSCTPRRIARRRACPPAFTPDHVSGGSCASSCLATWKRRSVFSHESKNPPACSSRPAWPATKKQTRKITSSARGAAHAIAAGHAPHAQHAWRRRGRPRTEQRHRDDRVAESREQAAAQERGVHGHGEHDQRDAGREIDTSGPAEAVPRAACDFRSRRLQPARDQREDVPRQHAKRHDRNRPEHVVRQAISHCADRTPAPDRKQAMAGRCAGTRRVHSPAPSGRKARRPGRPAPRQSTAAAAGW